MIAHDGTYAQLARIQDLEVSSSSSQPDLRIEAAGEPKTDSITNGPTHTSYTSVDETTTQEERDNYNHHKQRNIIFVVYRLIRETPELAATYSLVLAACLAGGKYLLFAILSNKRPGATSPGQANPFVPRSSTSSPSQAQKWNTEETSSQQCSSSSPPAVE